MTFDYNQPTLSTHRQAMHPRTDHRTSIAGYLTAALLLLAALMPLQGAAQSPTDDISLSLGVAAGTAPQFTLGSAEESGGAVMLFGDLQLQQIVGQATFTSISGESIGRSRTLDNAYAIHGSLGYSLAATDRVEIPVLVTMGGMFIDYTTVQTFGTPGNSFTDGNLQVGITLAPRYSITEQISIIGSLRYLQGIVTANRSSQIDLVTAALGVRFTVR